MALTYGFFNSINHDRQYDAIQFGQIFDGIITDGIYGTYLKGMIVIASNNANEVIIQPGRAWFNHTWSYNDANLPFAAPEPEVLLDRVDTLVLDVNLEQAERQNKYLWVQGEPSSQNPQAPTLIRSITHNQYPLCDVYRKAGTTMIYAENITNRIGTSDTPFVTGVLEGIDLDAWINQWDNEFHNWETATKISFEAWMLNQQEVYTSWFDSLKDQMEGDLDEFEAWFETIKDIIDESAATHLQAEIDALKLQLPAGSHITVTTQNSELYGRNVTVTDGDHPTTSKFDISGVAEIETYPYVGNLTITSTDGIRTASTTVNVPYFGRYSFPIAFWAAVVNINGGVELAGYQVTIKNSSDAVVSTVVLDENGQGVWTAIEPDTYKFSVTYGGETMEVSLNVTQETTYTVEIHGGFNYNAWLLAGGVSGTFASLNAVLADEKTVRKLMTKHDSVDYLANFKSTDASVVTILNNDYAAKWITLRDYAEDKLTAKYGTLMGTIGKYGYGEWGITDATTTPPTWGALGNVPVMTSNSAPYGEAIGSGVYSSSYPYYYAFDGSDTTAWAGTKGQATGNIGYMFTNPVRVKRLKFKNSAANVAKAFKTYKVQAFDGTNWTDITNTLTADTTALAENTAEISNNDYYLGYRIACLSVDGSIGSGAIGVVSLQFYGRTLRVSVPKMSGNTTPYGVAFGSSQQDDYFHAFDKLTGASGGNYGWLPQPSDTSPYVAYDFGFGVKAVSFAYVGLCSYAFTPATVNGYIEATNEKTGVWTPISSEYTFSGLNTSASAVMKYFIVPINVAETYRHYRLRFTSRSCIDGSHFVAVRNLDFYGKDYSEREWDTEHPRHYIYDHGVELEALTAFTTDANCIARKDANRLYVSVPATSQKMANFSASLDLTPYDLMRCVVGDAIVGASYMALYSYAPTLPSQTVISEYAMSAGSIDPYQNGIDISSVDQTCYPAFLTYNGSGAVARTSTITEWWLE